MADHREPIDTAELDKLKEQVKSELESMTPLKRALMYHVAYLLGERIDGIDARIARLAPRKTSTATPTFTGAIP